MIEAKHDILNVLLVEDDDITNFLSSIALKKSGVKKIDTVLNGEQAIAYMENKCPDLIFLDLNMPVMDGFDFLELKQQKGVCLGANIAILTSSSRPIDMERANSFNNIIDYLEKPLSQTKVEKLLAKL